MPLMFRAMLRDGDRPKAGPTKKELGVQVGDSRYDDITPDSVGDVAPESGGMSVAQAWRDLPKHRIPRRLQAKCPGATGHDNYNCWWMGEGPFEDAQVTDQLVLRVDRINHGTVQPVSTMPIDQFQQALAGTQGQWTIDEE